jgi:hypothetical protein
VVADIFQELPESSGWNQQQLNGSMALGVSNCWYAMSRAYEVSVSSVVA